MDALKHPSQDTHLQQSDSISEHIHKWKWRNKKVCRRANFLFKLLWAALQIFEYKKKKSNHQPQSVLIAFKHSKHLETWLSSNELQTCSLCILWLFLVFLQCVHRISFAGCFQIWRRLVLALEGTLQTTARQWRSHFSQRLILNIWESIQQSTFLNKTDQKKNCFVAYVTLINYFNYYPHKKMGS